MHSHIAKNGMEAITAVYIGLFQRVLPVQQVTPVRKASKDSDSTYLKYSEQFDMYYKSATKKAQMINDGAISSYNYTASGLESEGRDEIPHFDKQA